ncbi:hypothetical protein McaMca56_003452 [Microsporum canis]
MKISRYLLLLVPLLSQLTTGIISSGESNRCGFEKSVEDLDFISDPVAGERKHILGGNVLQDFVTSDILCHIATDGQPTFLRQHNQKHLAERLSRRESQSPVTNIISMKTIILALHVLGAAESAEQISKLCEMISFKRLTDNGLDGSMLQSLLCKRNDLDFYLPASSNAVKALLETWYTGLWLQTVYVAFAGHYPELCKIFETKKMSIIHMNGTLLRQALCSV